MAKNTKVVTPMVINVELPHGFKAIPTVAMELDVLMLKKAITPRMDSLRKAIGNIKAEKLSGFCTECLQFGKTVYVTVVAKMIAPNENGQSYLCLCPCGEDAETFAISSSFLRVVDISKKYETKQVQATKPQQQKVAFAA